MNAAVLSPEAQQIVERLVESGDYTDEISVLESALRHLDQHLRETWMREAIAAGIADVDRGRTIPMTPEYWEEAMQRAIRRAAAGERPSPHVIP